MLRVSDTFAKTVKGNQNRVKRTGGFSRKELGRGGTKYSDNKIMKRLKKVKKQRESRSENAFDSSILRIELVWPYENGMPKNLEEECKKPLGPGW